MKKLQQFYVLALKYDRLKNSNFEINGLQFEVAKKNKEIIAIADNEVLRAIRMITQHPFDAKTKETLVAEYDKILKQPNSFENKKKLCEINSQIENQLFIPQYISVTTPKKSKYKNIGKNGFLVNGKKYVRLICTPSHARTNRSMFIDKTIYDKANIILSNGLENVKMSPSKFSAYYGLTATAGFRVSEPKVCVVDDFEFKAIKTIDWITQSDDNNTIERCDKELEFNAFDGEGLITPQKMQEYCNELECDYLPSDALIRNCGIKGEVIVFDFHRFAKEVAHTDKIVDIYGEEYNINDIDILLSKSQFKFWREYKSWQQYLCALKKSGLCWNIARIAPKKNDNTVFTNYQFLQVLNLSDEDINNLCKPTVDWIKAVSGGDVNKTILYLLGKGIKETKINKVWDNIRDNFLKALMLNNELVEDNYIKERITLSLQKRIRETYIGNLMVDGCFSTMIADPYAFCEHAFGLKVKGLLNEFEYYSNYWNEKGSNVVVAMRSPLTWRSEVNELKLKNSLLMNDWYKYIKTGIIYNIWGCDCLIHADSDFDGDCCMTTNNSIIIKGRIADAPIAYKKETAPKTLIKNSELYKYDALAFDSKIGWNTNIATALVEMLAKWGEDSAEGKEILKRMKLCRVYQGNEIDKAKGIKTKNMPKEYTKYSKIIDTDSEDRKQLKTFNNKIIIDKRPYFMRYRYKKYEREYKDFLSDFNTYSYAKWGCDFNNVGNDIKMTQEYKDFIDYRDKKMPFLDNNGVMNRICKHNEIEFKDIKKAKSTCDNKKLFNILYNFDIDIKDNKKMITQMQVKLTKYIDFRKNRLLAESDFNTYEQFYKSLRNECLEEISNNLQELANVAIFLAYSLSLKKGKDFAWDCFGGGVVKNILCNTNKAKIPMRNEVGIGGVEYLCEKFSVEDYFIGAEYNNKINEINFDDLQDSEEVFNINNDIFCDIYSEEIQ